ncbi:MAG TPA: beta-galactosidase trimerization domain-containing protein [Tepidisphaeraceae bacterium]|nr:beta-galactosidase trimerization domain-containing protein [Tepidisphaeraceae bacterium]
MRWGQNYYCATFSNTFLSRKAFLGAPEQAQGAATIAIAVPKAGKYLALIRYEAAPRFQTQFHLRVEQAGAVKLDRLYGARKNGKIWPFHAPVQPEWLMPWGAVENVVWEGHDAFVELDAGEACLILSVGKQPEPAAKRNVDLVMLTSDLQQVSQRIAKENYLPLDGMLTQAGDVYLKLHNAPGGAPVQLTVPPGNEHSPYWVHIRDWKPKTIEAQPGQSIDWVEVGSLLDTLNDGQWPITAKGDGALRFSIEIGVRGGDGKIDTVRRLDHLAGEFELAYRADTRYSREIRTAEEVLRELVDYLKAHPARGTAPRRTLVYGFTFDRHKRDENYNALLAEFVQLIGATALSTDTLSTFHNDGHLIHEYVDVRDKTPEELREIGQKLKADGRAEKVAVISLGDEITLPTPSTDSHTAFREWLKNEGVNPSALDPTWAEDWEKVQWSPGADAAKSNPRLFYYSRLYQHRFGIARQKALTDVLQEFLPNALIGANYSPHHGPFYLGETFSWVSLFREGAMTMPWSEDYIWQVPVGSQQMSGISLDMFRAGVRHRPNSKIHYYVMPHWPGNTPASWRRQFYSAIGHGAKILNLFEFRPVQAAYTENHVSLPAMYQSVRQALHELGTFEDIVQDGQVQPAQAGIWFSETGDIWDNHRAPFGAAKRTLYVAVRHQQIPLDVVVEADALSGDLKDYRLLYLLDQNVSRAASKAIAEWVKAGGSLFATAGAGMFDEFNQPNPVMRGLLGIEQRSLDVTPQPVRLEKQDLAFAKTVDHVTLNTPSGQVQVPVIDARSRFDVGATTQGGATVGGRFSDGSSAVTVRSVGEGQAMYCGFLPGLSYFKPAIPMRPADRGTTDDSMAHFVPTEFHRGASALIGSPAGQLKRQVLCSEPLVETMVIRAPQGIVIPLVNWSGHPIKGLTLKLPLPGLPTSEAKLASGAAVVRTAGGYVFDLEIADALILR